MRPSPDVPPASPPDAAGAVVVVADPGDARVCVSADSGYRAGPLVAALAARRPVTVVADRPAGPVDGLGEGVRWVTPAEVTTGSPVVAAVVATGACAVLFCGEASPADVELLAVAHPGVQRLWAGPVAPSPALAGLVDAVVTGLDGDLPPLPAPTHGTPQRPVIEPVATVAGSVSVVIPVHGKVDLTERCIASVRATAGPAVEVVVVDDASPDDTRARLAARPDVVLVCLDDNLGFPGAVNRGLAASTGELVCILNNDTVVVDGWLDEMTAVLEQPGCELVGPRSDVVAGLQRVPDAVCGSEQWARQWSRTRAGCSWTAPVLIGFCLLARRRLFERLGGLDERFGRGNFEDVELSRRVRADGGDLRVADGAVVLHVGSATFGSLDRSPVELMAEAARRAGDDRDVGDPLLTTLVLSDGQAEEAARTAARASALGGEVLVLERGDADRTRLLCGPGHYLGVEVVGVDWTDGDAVGPWLDGARGRWLLVLSAGEELRRGDVGSVRAEVESIAGDSAGVRVGDRSEIRIHRRHRAALAVVGGPAHSALTSVAVDADPIGPQSPPAPDAAGLLARTVELAGEGDLRGALDHARRAAALDPSPAAADLVATLTAALSDDPPPASPAPADRLPITAIIAAYNEDDVIHHALADLVAQDIDVVLIDHHSTDDTVARASTFLGRGLVRIESFPDDAGVDLPTDVYAWRFILARKEQIARELGPGWFVHLDADEFRESPWPGTTLREGIERVDAAGYDAIDFHAVDFVPTDDGFRPGDDVRERLLHHDPEVHPANRTKINCWRQDHREVDLWSSGGHDVRFEGRRVYPVKFILRHYPVRSQQHGMRKVFADRKQRWDDDERRAQWHQHYDHVVDADHRFVRPAAELVRYDGDALRAHLLGPAPGPVAPRVDAHRDGYHDFPRPEVRALVPTGARRILDVGCGAGAMGAELRRERGGTGVGSIEVWGIEPVAEAATAARDRLDQVMAVPVEDALAALPDRFFDAVVFADVLEHLVEPAEVLRAAARKLTPSGRIVVSIPNVRHWSVVGELLQGRWEYQDAGILDRTHLRFFTRAGVVALLEEAGLVVEHMSATTWRWPSQPDGLAEALAPLGLDVSTLSSELEHYQYLTVAAPATPPVPAPLTAALAVGR